MSDYKKLLEAFLTDYNHAFEERIKKRTTEKSQFHNTSRQTESGINEASLAIQSTLDHSVVATFRPKLIHVDTLKQLLEKLTKKFNATCSINKKIRNDINSFRKERTLYDHVFKNLESLILQEEKKLMIILRKDNDLNQTVKAADENLSNIIETVKKFDSENFSEILQQEKTKYNTKIKTADEYSKRNLEMEKDDIDRTIEFEETVVFKEVEAATVNFRKSRFETSDQTENRKTIKETMHLALQIANENRVSLMEKLVKEFKYKTEENSIESALDYFNISSESFDEKYQKLVEMEKEVFLKA